MARARQKAAASAPWSGSRFSIAFILAVTGMVAQAHAGAITLSAPDFSAEAGAQGVGPVVGPIVGGPGTGASITCTFDVCGATGNASSQTSATPSASASSTGDAFASAGVEYSLAVVGPSLTNVPVEVTGTLSAFASEGNNPGGLLNAFGQVAVVGTGGCVTITPCNGVDQVYLRDVAQIIDSGRNPVTGLPLPFQATCLVDDTPSSLCSLAPGAISLQFSQEILLPVNAIESVGLGAGAGTNLDGQFANGFADPFFQIDPTFLAANPGFSLVVSPGVENNPPTTAVPEPPSLALLGVGVIGIIVCGAVGARRRVGPCAA